MAAVSHLPLMGLPWSPWEKAMREGRRAAEMTALWSPGEDAGLRCVSACLRGEAGRGGAPGRWWPAPWGELVCSPRACPFGGVYDLLCSFAFKRWSSYSKAEDGGHLGAQISLRIRFLPISDDAARVVMVNYGE